MRLRTQLQKDLCQGLVILLLSLWGGLGVSGETLPRAYQLAQTSYAHALSNRVNFPTNAAMAADLARACLQLAELSTNSQQRAALADQGLQSARFATNNAPALAAGYLYLALNMGEMARTKLLGALPLLRQMERALLRAIELDPQLDYAGASRSLGMLYLEAPGWPASVGNKRKAREYLERAVSLVPDYPDNHLSLLEAYVRWRDAAALEVSIPRYQKLIPSARQKYSGPEWEQPWKDWEERWQSVLKEFEKQNSRLGY